ncbi:MAG: GNAT family N-acetyltransferase [Propionibacteriaceae bacterium]|nr:GNAT family N-acetyltransferase [Propionibacteriaceae bacterium]
MELGKITTVTREGLPLILSPFMTTEAQRVYELCQDPEIQRWTTVPSPYTLTDGEKFVTQFAPAAWEELANGSFSTEHEGAELCWGLRIAGSSEPAGLWGSIGLKRIGNRDMEIGWWLGADVRGHGIMKAAVEVVIQTAFSPDFPLHAASIRWYAYVGNHASAVIAQRTGFAYEGINEHPPSGGPASWTAVLYPGDPMTPRDGWPDLLPE